MNRSLKIFLAFIVRPMNSFTLIILIGFALVLLWLGQKRFDDYVQANHLAAKNAGIIVSAETNRVINDKVRLVQIFLEDHYAAIIHLARNSDDETQLIALRKLMARYFDDFFSVNIASGAGLPIIDDFEGRLGEICQQDMQAFAKDSSRIIRVHPNHLMYHFDIVVAFDDQGERKLFFVSFSLDDIVRLLRLAQPEGHQLMLVQKHRNHLIEVTDTGSRNSIPGRLDFRMTEAEIDRLLFSIPVHNTLWHVMDMHRAGLFRDYHSSLFKEGGITYGLFAMCLLVIRQFLSREENRRARAESELRKRNQDYEQLNRELKQANLQLSRTSLTDGMTGLNNRHYFDQRLEEELKRARRTGSMLSLLFIDVDYFKAYNDYYGHQAGDTCLVRLAGIMQQCFKRADDFIARYGGEEFVVILAGADKDHALAVVKKFQQLLLRAAIKHEGSQISPYVTISAGLAAMFVGSEDSVQQIINRADQALYVAKSEGRNRIKTYSDPD